MTGGAYDVAIVGAGSAGSVLAARLSADGRRRVLLLEAGGRDASPWIHIPLGVGKLLSNERYMWKADTEPQAGLKGNRLYWPSGRVLGGSSSVNGMVFVRGHPHRYDAWRDAGCPGWGYADLLPYFQKLEDCAFGDPAERGRGGPISVSRWSGDALTDGFVAACGEAGFPAARDYNVGEPEGASPLQYSTRNGRRCSAAVGYLRGAEGRANLEIHTNALARRVSFEGGRATGVEFLQDGVVREARAKEIILCAGALRSPQLLELSGIGDAEVLRRAGIPVVHHLPGVGENLQDHLMPRLTFECNVRSTVNDLLGNPLRMAAALARYALFREGLFATPSLTGTAFVRSRPDAPHTDVRLQIAQVSASSRFSISRATGIDPHSGFHLGGYFLFPRSRGRLHVRSKDPAESPVIDANYLAHPEDADALLAVMRLMRKVASQPSLARYIVREVRPGPKVADDAAMLDYARETGQTCWHPAGTCRMGDGPDAVVDPQLRVRGVDGLRVVDASVMPHLVASNTNIPVIAIAERAADLVAAA